MTSGLTGFVPEPHSGVPCRLTPLPGQSPPGAWSPRLCVPNSDPRTISVSARTWHMYGLEGHRMVSSALSTDGIQTHDTSSIFYKEIHCYEC